MNRTLKMLALVLVVATAAAAPAAPPKEVPKLGEGKGEVTLSWDEFVKITGYDPAKGAQTLTVPWSEVESLLGVKVEKVGKGATVDLPWAEFKSLLEWSIKRKADEPGVPPPTDFIITSSQYKGELTADGAKFTLTMNINVLRKKGWKKIPVLASIVALTKTTLPADVFLNSTGNSYEILTEKSGAIDVALEFSVAVKKSAGINQVGFPRVAAGSSLLDLTIDRENVDVKVANSQSLVAKSAAGKTHVAAAIPSGAAVGISWERALPKVEAVPTKLYAETRTLVAVAEGMLICQENVSFNILHTAVRELKLTVPKGASVLTVTCSNIQDWRVDDKGELLVVLRGEVIGSHSLRVTYEYVAKDAVEAPVIHVAGAQREKGFVAVIAVANVEITSGEVAGATPIDVRQLPGDIVAMTNQPILLAYRYVGEKFSIPLTIKKHGEVDVLVTIVDSGLFTAMQLNDGRRMTKVVYTVRNNRNQFLRLKMPAKPQEEEKAEIWSVTVSGNNVSPAQDEEGNVLIPLVRSTSRSRELASFPVEIVYVETPKEVAPAKGKLRVDLPSCGVPVMHLMYNYYAPIEGKYAVAGGLFSPGRSGFSGPLGLVDEFASLSSEAGAAVVRRDAAKQAKQMQQQFDARVDARARAAGATPIRVRLPINGKLFKLEKILALPKDVLYFEVEYSGWKVAK